MVQWFVELLNYETMKSQRMKCLIISDLQNDFHPVGMAAIEGSKALIPIINAQMDNYELIIATQFWYPTDHVSFAANHMWRKPNQTIKFEGEEIELKEMHCVADSFGAELMMGLNINKIEKVFKKGSNPTVTARSAFFDSNNHSTGLEDFLKTHNVSEIDLVGINFENGLVNSIEDGEKLGFKVKMLTDIVLGI